jgi:hypothetical protein
MIRKEFQIEEELASGIKKEMKYKRSHLIGPGRSSR